MPDVVALVDSYGLLVVLSGLISSMLCGCFKIPITAYIRKQDLGDKATSARITTVCTTLVALFSSIIIILWECLSVWSFTPLLTAELYSKILLSISFAKIAYMLYEGVGPVSLKQLIHRLLSYVGSKASPTESAVPVNKDIVEIVQEILLDQIHMPLTDAQKKTLDDHLTERFKDDE